MRRVPARNAKDSAGRPHGTGEITLALRSALGNATPQRNGRPRQALPPKRESRIRLTNRHGFVYTPAGLFRRLPPAFSFLKLLVITYLTTQSNRAAKKISYRVIFVFSLSLDRLSTVLFVEI